MYDHQSIEKKWQQTWERTGLHRAEDESAKPKFYSLETFPYPSAAGLHVGHPEGYTAEDIHARYRRMNGDDVLYTMGWDAFGLPTENYAIKIGKNPKDVAAANIENFRRQVKMLGFSYDWSREINTSDPTYYRWTQWLFLQLYKHGLAYRAEAPVNWCESCKTVLANEQVEDGVCERCKNPVTQRMMLQWFFKITPFAERLLDGLEKLDWPESTKIRQKNWVGKKQGINITYAVDGSDETVVCFTTRPDTNFGATFIVLGPEHPAISRLTTAEQRADVERYVSETRGASEARRIAQGRKKTGVFTGAYAINNLNGAKLPIWVGDFVLGTVGTGAVVGVPGHDQRDFDFAVTFGLPVLRVVVGPDGDTSAITRAEQVQEEEGTMLNSGFLDGLDIHAATERVMDHLEQRGWGKRVTSYHLRDWLVSRQRYWGAPIPIIHCPSCGAVPVPEEHLPVTLPDDVDFRPTGEPPLARSKTFHDVRCPQCGKKARRESETLDTFVDSSWYFFRYTDPRNEKEFASRDKLRRWLPVDLYIIGAEHTVLHLLYARFITKVLHDLNYIDFEEPFLKLRHIGLILGDDNQKMSKSRGNVVNPDAVVEEFGADSLRMYEMFMGPLEDAKPWQTNGIRGIRRFLDRVWQFGMRNKSPYERSPEGRELGISDAVVRVESTMAVGRMLNQTIKKVSDDIASFHYNTAVSQYMVMLRELEAHAASVDRKTWETFLTLLAPFAPHITEELWERSGHTKSIFLQSWPSHDATMRDASDIALVVQVNGKVRATLAASSGLTQSEAEARARDDARIKKWLEGRDVARTIYVQDKVLNFVLAEN